MCIDSRPGRTLGLLLAAGLVCSFVGCNPMSAFLMNRTGLAYYCLLYTSPSPRD